ncbi:protein kinase [Streptomyces sp. NPDC059533]|uniref:protein kinase domain-containing protein n=1 Tax=unclassified Streptomyces TaxID=2593676 RepID=UPI0036748DF2
MRVGDRLADRYRLDRRLGQGGMGEVWRAHDVRLDRSVAVKVLLEAVTGEEAVARFLREATIGARLQHPGITVVHDVGQEDGRRFIVMELLSGEDLGTVLARERAGLPVDTALDLAAQTAEALAAAHEQSVVHRDLKPANLFLLSGDRVKVCDFGIAHSADATAGLTATGRVFGTPAYMAPEQVLGRHVDARCDLYALGCVLYALLSGGPPFGVEEPLYVLLRRHVEDAPPDLGISPALGGLLTALLAKAPADRPESAEAAAKALRGLVGAGAAPAYVPTLVDPAPQGEESPWKFVRELLREVEETLGAATGGAEPHVRALTAAADAAARFDAGLAGRLLAAAEAHAWTAGGGDGARIAPLLAELAAELSEHAPARAERLTFEAEQALFTVFGSNREQALRAVAPDLAVVAPERGAHLALESSDGDLADTAWALAALAAARTDSGPVDLYLDRIEDAPSRAFVEAQVVKEIGSRDLPAALRRAGQLGEPGMRVLALAGLAEARALAGDAQDAADLLGSAERAAAHALRERAAALREEATGLAAQGQPVRAERLRGQAEGLLRPDPVPVGDGDADELLRALAKARWSLDRGPRVALDPATAREQAAEARSRHPAGPERAFALARIALRCVDDERTPWLPGPTADPGTPPDHRPVSAEGADAPLPVNPRTDGLSGVPRWSTPARPDSVRRAGANVAWLAGDRVGCVRVGNGATLWIAEADAGVPGALPDGPRTVALAADPDGGSVCVAVESRNGPGVRLLAREPLTGRVLWWRDLPGEKALDPHPARAGGRDAPSPFAVTGGLVLYGGRKAVTALSVASGEEVWRRSGPYDGSLSPAVGPDGLVLAERERLTGLQLSTGAFVWSGRPGADPAVAPAGPSVPVGPVHVVSGRSVRALHQGTGRQLWATDVGVPAPELLVTPRVVYAAGTDKNMPGAAVYAIEAETGRALWQRRVTLRYDSWTCPLELLGIRAGLLYVKCAVGGRRLLGGSEEPFVTALDLHTGETSWRWEHPAIGTRNAVLHGDSLVLPLPALTAVALP